MRKLGNLFGAFLALAVVFPLSATAATLENNVAGKSYLVRCDGQVMHASQVNSSPCAANQAPKSKLAVDAGPKEVTSVDSTMNGPFALSVSNGQWMNPDLTNGTFTGQSWSAKITNGQVYPADPVNQWPETTVYFGNVVDTCGSSSAVILAIEKPTPEVGTLSVRLNVCDIPAINGTPQVYIEAECQLYTGNRRTMGGTIGAILFDNRELNDHPVQMTKYSALCMVNINH